MEKIYKIDIDKWCTFCYIKKWRKIMEDYRKKENFKYYYFKFMIEKGLVYYDGKGNFYKRSYCFLRKRKVKNMRKIIYRKYNRKGKKGYIRINIRYGKKYYVILAHRMVWFLHKNEILRNRDIEQINHKNGIKHYNEISNLEKVTPKENVRHAIEVLGTFKVKGEDNKASKLKNEDVIKMRLLYRNGTQMKAIYEMYKNVSKGNIRRILKRKTWKHL